MTSPADTAKELLNETLTGLLKRVKSEDAKAADFTAALQACRMMGVEQVPVGDNPAALLKGALTDSLPFADGGAYVN